MTNFGATPSNAPIPGTSLANVSWTALTIGGGWSQDGGSNTVAYYNAQGFVFLRGGLIGGALSTTFATLPTGSRPAHNELFPVVTGSNTIGLVTVASSGTIQLIVGNTGFLCLEGIRISL